MIEHQDLWALVDRETPFAERLVELHQLVNGYSGERDQLFRGKMITFLK